MSEYTTELRYICESLYDNKTHYLDTVETVIAGARPKIFNFAYPYYKESDRESFEIMILRHFYTREIGCETYGLWKLKLEDWLINNMPYYNELYKSAELEFNPLYDYDETRVLNRDTKDVGESTGSGNSSSNSIVKNLDTPQNGITDLLNGNYLTNASQATSSGDNNTTQSTTTTGDENVTETITGKRGGSSYGKLLTEYRNAIINVNVLVLNAMEELFMGIW